jgi:mannitol-1-/sugar-/sorbitol-6-/2-deoxyglucose-6-phosphatase
MVAFRFHDDLPDVERHRVLEELDQFPSRYHSMRRWALGPNISKRDSTFTHAFSIEFDNEEELVSYLSSETHERFVRERFRPAVAARAIVSFEAPPERSEMSDQPELRDLYPSPVQGMIFDMDGLLIDTGPAWRRVGDELFAALGVDISPLSSRGAVMGMRLQDASALLKEYAGFDASDLPDLDARVERAMIEAVRNEVTLKPGALDALDFCDEHGLSAALASGSTLPIIETVLERFDLSGRFRVVSSASDDGPGKPHPELFLRTAAALGLESRHCAVLEDAVSGCIAGKAAGMRVIVVPDGPVVDDPRFSIADAELHSLEEIRLPHVLALLGLEDG